MEPDNTDDIIRETFRRIQVDPKGMGHPIEGSEVTQEEIQQIMSDETECLFALLRHCEGMIARRVKPARSDTEYDIGAICCDYHAEKYGFER